MRENKKSYTLYEEAVTSEGVTTYEILLTSMSPNEIKTHHAHFNDKTQLDKRVTSDIIIELDLTPEQHEALNILIISSYNSKWNYNDIKKDRIKERESEQNASR